MHAHGTPSSHRSAGRLRRPPARRAVLGFVFIALLLLLAPAQALGGGWTRQHYQQTGLVGLDFVDAQHGWVVGTNGVILATTNGGAAWQSQTSGTTEALQAIDFVDASYGWAVGYKGTILKTTDGGANWTKQTSGVTNNIYGVAFVNHTQGWACGYYGLILSTADGGASWTRVIYPFGDNMYSTALYYDVAMADGAHGWIVGEDEIARPTGGDPPWALTMTGSSHDNLHAVDYASATHAWAAGWSGNTGVVYATTDGATWQTQTTGSSEPLEDVSSPTANNVWLAGYRGTVFSTTDGGATWQSQSTGSGLLNAIDFPDTTHGWALGGPGGSIYVYGQSGAQPVPKALANVTVKRGKTASLPYRVDSAAATCTVTIKIERNGKTVKEIVITEAKTNTNLTKRFTCKLAKGTYTWYVSAVADGVTSAKASSKKLTVK